MQNLLIKYLTKTKKDDRKLSINQLKYIIMKAKNLVVINLVKNPIWTRFPNVNEFNSKQIKEVIPCTKRGEKFFSWETGEEVKLNDNSQIWPLLVGTMFRLKNGENVLLNRKCNGKVFLDRKTPFNPSTMVLREAK